MYGTAVAGETFMPGEKEAEGKVNRIRLPQHEEGHNKTKGKDKKEVWKEK